jgi:hypothetical protein
LATVTQPTLSHGQYATPMEIAGAWRCSSDRKQVEYFHKNRGNKIRTFQDDAILAALITH